MLIGNTCYPSVLHQNRSWIHTIDFVKSCINIVMRAVFVNNIKKHFDYSDIHIIFAVQNKVTERLTTASQFKFSCMLTFSVIRSAKTGRIYIYNQTGAELAQCDSMKEVFNYFYNWSVKFCSKSLTYSFTKSKDVLLVKMD